MKLDAQAVGTLVQKAFCLEAIADKPGCTGRHQDLPGKPLEDFVIAAINVGPVFAEFAASWISGNKQEIFAYQKKALLASNQHKSPKYVSMGLIELLLPFVAARLECDKPGKVIDVAVELLKKGGKADVEHLCEIRRVGWKDSKNAAGKLRELDTDIVDASSPGEYYARLAKHTHLVPAAYQWGQLHASEYAIIRQQFDYLNSHDEPILERIKNAFTPVYEDNPDTKIGILADASAVAIFLHLSFIE